MADVNVNEDEQFYRDTESVAFPKLDDPQLALLEPLGARRIVRRGELVFRTGQRDMPLVVVLRGSLEAFEARDGQERNLATVHPRDFVGDVAMLTGTAALAGVRGVAEETEILEVPAVRLRQALKPDTLIEIQVVQLYGDFRPSERPAAVLAMRFLFFDAANGIPGRVILQREYSRSIPLQARTPAALVEGWNQALARILDSVMMDFGRIDTNSQKPE